MLKVILIGVGIATSANLLLTGIALYLLLRGLKRMAQIDDKEDQILSDLAGLSTASKAVTDKIVSLRDELAAGLTPDQLAKFNQIHELTTNITQALTAAAADPASPAPPAPVTPSP